MEGGRQTERVRERERERERDIARVLGPALWDRRACRPGVSLAGDATLETRRVGARERQTDKESERERDRERERERFLLSGSSDVLFICTVVAPCNITFKIGSFQM